MTLQKAVGVSEGYYLTLGTTIFAVIKNYGYRLPTDQEEQWTFAKKESPQPGHSWDNTPEIGEQNSSIIAYAFKERGKDWVITENYTGDQLIGRLLMTVDRDKKKRISIEEFKPLLSKAYSYALTEELATILH